MFECIDKDIGLCPVVGRLVGWMNGNYYQLSHLTLAVKGQHVATLHEFASTSFETTMHFCNDRHANKP